MLEKALVKLGLSDKEARVYLALLELGQDTVQHIAQRAQVRRPTAYVILEKLLRLGLVSTITRVGKSFFVAESPRELSNVLTQQVRDIADRQRLLEDTMGQLLAHYRAADKPVVRYFEGTDGLLTLDKYGQDRQKKTDQDVLSILPIDILEAQFAQRRKEAIKERLSAGIRSRTIYTHKAGPIPESIHQKENRIARFIPRERLPIDMTISIYSWGVKLYYLNEQRPLGILIEDQDIARNMRAIFELAWHGAGQE